MEVLTDFAGVQECITTIRSLKKGYVTNFFPDPEVVSLWIQKKNLFKVQLGETIFLYKKVDEFYSLYFISTSNTSLHESLVLWLAGNPETIFVVDLVGNERVFPLKEVFENLGFQQYTKLVRMSRMAYHPLQVFQENEHLKVAIVPQVAEILTLFQQYFDPKAEQLPSIEELHKWIRSGSLLTYVVEQKVVGFIIYDLNGVTLYLRYWFVHPAYREKKIGSQLFNYFIYKGKTSKRQLFWVIESNENAIKRYKHFGFSEEKMYNLIMINRNSSYEG